MMCMHFWIEITQCTYRNIIKQNIAQHNQKSCMAAFYELLSIYKVQLLGGLINYTPRQRAPFFFSFCDRLFSLR